MNDEPYCTLCENHCLLSQLQCARGRQFYGTAELEQENPNTAHSNNLVMRFEMCWHQFRRIRGGLDGQVRVLRFLYNHGSATQREIQEALGIKSAAISEHISKLEGQRYIIRTNSEKDRRAKVIRFTPEGEKAFSEMVAAEIRKDLFAALTEDEKISLMRLLKKLSSDWRNRETVEE